MIVDIFLFNDEFDMLKCRLYQWINDGHAPTSWTEQ